jgi:hypothetical protein
VKKRYNSKPDDNMLMFVGLDVHKKYTGVAVVDEDGALTEQERIERERMPVIQPPYIKSFGQIQLLF